MHSLSTIDIKNLSDHISATNNLIYCLQIEALHRINQESIIRKALQVTKIINQNQIPTYDLSYEITNKDTSDSDKIKKLIIHIKKEIVNLETDLLINEILKNKDINTINTKEEYNLNKLNKLICSSMYTKNIIINVKDCKNNYEQLKTPYNTFWTEKISNTVIALDVPNNVGIYSIVREPYITFIDPQLTKVNFSYKCKIEMLHPKNIFVINFKR